MKLDLTALKMRDLFYAVDKGAGRPWTGTVADLCAAIDADKRRVPEAIFQLIDAECPIEYSQGVITFRGVIADVPAAPETVTAVATKFVEIMSIDDLADQARRRAELRKCDREDSLRRAGQLTFEDMDLTPPTAPKSEPTPIVINRPTPIRQRPTVQAAAAWRLAKPLEPKQVSAEATMQPSNETTVQPLHGCKIAELGQAIAEKLASKKQSHNINARTPAHTRAISKDNNINLNQSNQGYNPIDLQINQDSTNTREATRWTRTSPDWVVYNGVVAELERTFPALWQRPKEQLAYMMAWGTMPESEYRAAIEEAQRARAPCNLLYRKIEEFAKVYRGTKSGLFCRKEKACTNQ